MNYWIFQGNPNTFDVEKYIEENSLIWWTIRQKQHLATICVGDRVFIWKADGTSKRSGGIVALGTVKSSPILRTDEDSQKYWKTDDWKIPGYGVQISIEDTNLYDNSLKRNVLLANDSLSDLKILRMPVGTNFLITTEQFNLLYSLWEGISREFPIIQDSWKIIDEKVFIKKMDKSCFLHRGTGIPKDFLQFWSTSTFSRGEKKILSVKYNSNLYTMKLECENIDLMRIRLFWDANFLRVIKSKFPKIMQHLKSGNEIEDFPEMRFLKIEEDNYEVTFIDTKLIVKDEPIEKDDLTYEQVYREGRTLTYYGKRYERDPKVRVKAIEVHGTKCSVCNFDFELYYGERGEGYIEIHHKYPLYKNGEAILIDPKTDLVPLCSNCHRMIHREKNKVLTIEELKSIINNHNSK